MQLLNIEKILLKEGFLLKHYEQVDSTMVRIKELFKYNKKNNFFVIADKQIKGKGRRGNLWFSPKGNIYLSFILEIKFDIQNHFIINAATTLSVSKTIDFICNVNSKIKWPNDILVKGKKISGVISEVFQHDKSNYIRE